MLFILRARAQFCVWWNMRKSKLLYLITLLMCGACSKQVKTPFISLWTEKIESSSVVERRLAATPQGKCLKDIFTVETLKAEVAGLEKAYSKAEPISGNWKHLSFDKLPLPQAIFLKNFGDKLGDLNKPESIDYSGCQDVPCIINRVYGDGFAGRAGYVHYLWFLKFGNYLAADNEVPQLPTVDVAGRILGYNSPLRGFYQGAARELKEYLYTADELYAFWRLSFMLKESHGQIPMLKEIQRIPRGQKLERYPSSCGLASTEGWIMLADACLQVAGNWGSVDKGWFYNGVTHELSHMIDYFEGKKQGRSFISDKPEYYTMAGFTREEEFRRESNTILYTFKPNMSVMVSTYAASSPAENFADTMAYYRLDGDLTKSKISRTHYAHMSEFYQNRNFEVRSLIDDWIGSHESLITKTAMDSVAECGETPSSPLSFYLKAADFKASVPASTLHCLSGRAEVLSRLVKSRVLIKEPEACEVFSLDPRDQYLRWTHHTPEGYNAELAKIQYFDQNLKKTIAAAMNSTIESIQKDPVYIEKVKSLLASFSKKDLGVRIFLECFGEEDEKACYQSSLRSSIFTTFADSKLSETEAQEMFFKYQSMFPFEALSQEILDSYATFIRTQAASISQSAESFWRSCLSGSSDDLMPPRGDKFSVGDGYLVSSIFNCLNDGFAAQTSQLISSFSVDQLKVESAQEKKVFGQMLGPVFEEELRKLYEGARALEAQAVVESFRDDSEKLRPALLEHREWVTTGAGARAECQKAVSDSIEKTLLFNLRKELIGQEAEKFCVEFLRSDDFKKTLEADRATLLNKLYEKLNVAVYEFAQENKIICLARFPLKDQKLKLQREKCLNGSWDAIEAKAAVKLSRDPMTMALDVSLNQLKGQARSSRTRNQQLMKL